MTKNLIFGSVLASQISRHLFRVADTDKNGSISREEFSDVLAVAGGGKESEADRRFAEFDTDNSGELSEQEVGRAVERTLARLHGMSEETLGDGRDPLNVSGWKEANASKEVARKRRD
jgi:Ca2+-binding EF-hand superfamily protein